MKQFLHSVWPFLTVVALTTVLAFQIPRKALFFNPAQAVETTPFVSLVEYRPAAYNALVRHVRMSWQMRAQSSVPQFESSATVSGLQEEFPLPAELALPTRFFTRNSASPRLAVGYPSSLLPPTVADTVPLKPVAVPPDEEAEVRRLRADMLTLPESLQENE